MIINQEEFVDEQSFINRGKSTSMNKGVEGSSSRNNVSFIHFSSFYTNRISFAKFAAGEASTFNESYHDTIVR